MRPSEARQLLLAQHEGLRVLFAETERLAARLLAGESVEREFHDQLAALRQAFAAHNDSEQALLEPMLNGADAWGPLRVARMTEEHLAEHRGMHEMMKGEDREVARRLPDLAEELLAHMEAEERTVLSPAVLRDGSAADGSRNMADAEYGRLVEQLRTLRDEIKVKIHLAGMEAKEAWKELEPKARKLEGEMEAAGQRVVGQAKESFEEVKAALLKLRDKVRS